MFFKQYSLARQRPLGRLLPSARRTAKRVCADQKGNIAVLTALVLPVIIALGGGVIDWSTMRNQSERLQALADGAALAAVREMTLANTTRSAADAVVTTYVRAGGSGDNKQKPIKINTTVSAETQTVTVRLSQEPTAYFNSVIFQTVRNLDVSATARVLGTTKVCAIALDESKPNAMVLQSRARMTANDCAVFSNSVSSNGLHAKNSSRLVTSLTCSAGGYVGSKSNYQPQPVADCPPVEDPLAERAEPKFSAKCEPSKTNVTLRNTTEILSPGVYCGGLDISGNSVVRFRPGIYIIKDGPFSLKNTARIDGKNVGFFLSGNNAVFNFSRQTTVDLTAPKTGEMAGILFFESRSRIASRDHSIRSNNARTLLGTIYLPKSGLVIDSTDVVADRSAYTAIIARQIKLFDGPHLVLNANYDQTDIPAPEGIRNRNNAIGLIN